MKRELTDVWLRALKPPETGRLEVWDTRVAGLLLRLTPTGAASWSVRARTQAGKHTRPKLGTWPAMGITDARKEALAALSRIQRGGDPIAAKKAERAARTARASAPTVADRLGEWQRAREREWSGSYAAEVARMCRREIIPALGTWPLAETTRADWTKLVAAKRVTAPAAASWLFRLVSSFLGYAEAHGWVSVPLLPRKGLTAIAPPSAARERVLTDGELGEVWQASAELSPKGRAFVRLLVLTAARRNEVADLAVGELDREAARWTLPAARAKNGQAITLPLCALALAELQAVWPNRTATGAYRLLGDTAGSGRRGFSKLKAKLDAEIAAARAKAGETAPMPPWRLHDLRRTARTGMTRLGVPRDHAEAALNHVSGRSALERTYDRHDYAAEVLDALGRWQEHVAGVVGT